MNRRSPQKLLINLKGETNFRYLCAQAKTLRRVDGVVGSPMTGTTVATRETSSSTQHTGSVSMTEVKCGLRASCVNKVCVFFFLFFLSFP